MPTVIPSLDEIEAQRHRRRIYCIEGFSRHSQPESAMSMNALLMIITGLIDVPQLRQSSWAVKEVSKFIAVIPFIPRPHYVLIEGEEIIEAQACL